MTEVLRKLIDWARTLPPMTEEQREKQIISFAYGNVRLHNPSVTREMITEAAARFKWERVDMAREENQ